MLAPILGWLAASTAFLAVLLVVTKVAHRAILHWRGVRSAHYVSAIGELLSRRILPEPCPSGWAVDPVFHSALVEYRRILTGADRSHVDELARHSGVMEVVARRARRRFPLATRLRAISSLVDLAGPGESEQLRSLAGDSNPHARVNAVRGLATLRDVESVPLILGLLSRTRGWEASRLADALVALGPAGVDPICRWIDLTVNDPRGPVDAVSLAARVLGLIGDPAAEPCLIRLLDTNQPDWRVAAASALEHTGGEAAVPPLLDALDDRTWRVRARAVVALAALADPHTARSISGLLYDPVWWVRQNAAAALGVVPGGTVHLLEAAAGADQYAADAALSQLTVSGVLGEAMTRVEKGRGSDRDLALTALVGAS